MTLESAVKELEKEYEKARLSKWINNPLAYALYQVWKKADKKKRRSVGYGKSTYTKTN